ncbi:MAG: PAS domain S-box protein [Candidatus Saccharibacteria bacterium]|nr:PAS domain S-box protein [Pseudorhodobacter sp.]
MTQLPTDIFEENARLRTRLQQAEDLVRDLRSGDVDALANRDVARDANQLRVSEIRYRRLFEAAHDGILIVDPDTRKIIDANPFMTRLLGYSFAELVGMEVFEIGLFSDAQVGQDMFETLKATGHVRYDDLPLQTREGALWEIEVVANSYDENCHKVIQFNIRDITQRKQIQKALAASDNRFRLALQNSQISVLEQDTDLRYTWIYNPQFGYDSSSGLGKTDAELMDGTVAPQLTALKRGVLATGQSANQEVTVAAPGQAPHHFHLTVEPHQGPDGAIEGIISTAMDITDRKQAEVVLREREARQAFLLRVSDALRAEPGIEAKTDRALRMLAGQMRLDRCYVNIFRLEDDTADVPQQVHDDRLSPLPAEMRLSDFRNAVQVAQDSTVVIDNIFEMDGFSDGERTNFAGLGIEALIVATLRQGDDTPLWALVAASASPRVWTPGDISLVEEVAERTWAAAERARAEKRLQIAHDTFRGLIDRSPFGTYIVDADFRLVQMSEGGKKAFGIQNPLIGQDFSAVVRAIWPDPFARAVIARFRHTMATGEPFTAVTNERRADMETNEAYDWKIERIMLPDGRPGIVCHFYDLSEKQRQEDRIKLLMGEVNHRSKNMLGLIEAIARQTVKTQPEHFLEIFGKRVRALSASQDLLVKGAWKAVPLGELVRSQLAHFSDAHDSRITIDGPLVQITASASQMLGMALHELATNAAKFGALSNESGHVAIRWNLDPNVTGQAQFAMSWIESGGPEVAKPQRSGFGTTVIDNMLDMSLGCETVVDFAPTGLIWRIRCSAVGLIENAVPRPPRSNGIPADQEPALVSSRRILVVEDEALIAMDFSQSLSEAGYSVIGPANSVARALELLARSGCDAAVLDVNLGTETSEKVARELIRLGKPFITTSGYSREQMPEIMQSAPLLGKPVAAKMLIAEVERCLDRES